MTSNIKVFSRRYDVSMHTCSCVGGDGTILCQVMKLYFQLGDGSKKCIRYWPDEEISHEHIHVKYIQSESCPYYTRRELSVTNTKVRTSFLECA
jgi:hypothetical protein